MSFKLGDINTDDLAGVEVRPVSWPSLGGLELETLEAPGRDGIILTGHSQDQTEFTFDVLITGASPQVVYERRDAFVGILDPAQGPLPLQISGEEGWEYPAVMVSEEIDWERVIWRAGAPLSFRGDVVFQTVGDEPAARELDPQQVTIDGETTFTLDRGNTSTVPRVTVEVPDGAGGDDVTVTIGSFALTIEGGGSEGELLDLDWQQMEFHRRGSNGSRQGSLVPYMSNYGRPNLRPGQSVTVTCSPSDAVALLMPNARRV